jgi:tRNA (guanine37-N1)-methyltransferase
MYIHILTIFPEMFQQVFNCSIIKRAKAKKLVDIEILNIRDFSTQKQKSVDDYQYGGGSGMVMMIEPIVNAIEYIQKKKQVDEVVFLTPDGEKLSQLVVNELTLKKNLIFICGHYKGIDERIREHWVTREISIGDYVLSGGEIPAMVLTDAMVRLIPGVLSDETSALSDSFQDGLLAPPVYTRPSSFRGKNVPNILLSGHQQKIDDWRLEQSVRRTKQRRPDLYEDN